MFSWGEFAEESSGRTDRVVVAFAHTNCPGKGHILDIKLKRKLGFLICDFVG